MFSTRISLVVAILASLTLAAAAQAAGIPSQRDGSQPHAAQTASEVERVHKTGNRFERSVATLAKRMRAEGQKAKARHRRAEAARQEAAKFDAGSATVVGVPRSTLDAIAACESGGNPQAVNAAGYYGKYQFDTGTWASIGGSGNPADASEAEQDYRAAQLYQRSGASPWPVCGR